MFIIIKFFIIKFNLPKFKKSLFFKIVYKSFQKYSDERDISLVLFLAIGFFESESNTFFFQEG